jgi:hypothetical protein
MERRGGRETAQPLPSALVGEDVDGDHRDWRDQQQQPGRLLQTETERRPRPGTVTKSGSPVGLGSGCGPASPTV